MISRPFFGIAPMVIWLSLAVGYAQPEGAPALTLDSCLTMAERNYPQIAQYALLAKSTEYTLDNAEKGKLPQLAVYGQASYQSDVTSVPGSEMVGIPTVSKDQYKLYGEVIQPLTGIAVINHHKKIAEAQGQAEEANLTAKIYPVKERVSQLFFGALLLDGQIKQIALAKDDLRTGIEIAEAAVEYGTALKSTLNVLKAEFLSTDQRLIEQLALRRSYLDMLGRFIGEELSEDIQLRAPVTSVLSNEINRPELNVFDAQLNTLGLQRDLIDKNNLPLFSLFVQGGIGRPALNFLDNDLSPYYLGGLRLSWNIANFYTAGGQKQIYSLNQQIVSSEKETFLFNTRLSMADKTNQLQKMQQLMTRDEEILVLREEIVETAKGQLENGVITAQDYKVLVSDADRARQNLIIHEVELLRLQNEYKLIAGN